MIEPNATPTTPQDVEIQSAEADAALDDASHPKHADAMLRLRAAYEAKFNPQPVAKIPPTPASPTLPTSLAAVTLPRDASGRFVASETQLQAEITRLESLAGYLDATHPEHSRIVHNLRALFERLHPEESTLDPDAGKWTGREGYAATGVPEPNLPDALIPGQDVTYRDAWDHDAASDILQWSAEEGIAADVMAKAFEAYRQDVILGGKAVTGWDDADATRWTEQLIAWGMTKAQAARLVEHVRSNGS